MIQLTVHQKKRYAKFLNFDIIKLSKSKGMIGMNSITAHSSQLTAHADYVIGRVFCQALKQAFSRFCGEVFSVGFRSEVA